MFELERTHARTIWSQPIRLFAMLAFPERRS
jgi:hypothetical protein